MAVQEARGSITWTRRFEQGGAMLALIGLSIVFMLPLAITVSDSLKSFVEVYAVPRVWIPRPPRWSNYEDIFELSLPFGRFFVNTVIITVFALTGKVLSACFVGYSFSRMRWPFRDFFFVVLLSTLMLPGQVTMIPVYLLFNKLGWVNTWLPLIVPGFFGASVFNIFLLRQFFMTIPLALEDAAKIDGCSHLRILLTIMIPLAKPAIATVAVLGFIAEWNNFMMPLIYLSDLQLYPISLGVYMFMGVQGSQPQYVMAASLLALLPVLMLFFAAQRYFVKGIALSGIKG